MGWTTNLILFSPISEPSIVSSDFSHICSLIVPIGSDKNSIGKNGVGPLGWRERELFGLPLCWSPLKRGIYPRITPLRCIWGFPKMVGFPNKPMGFPTKNDHFWAVLWVPAFKETPIWCWWRGPPPSHGFSQHFPLWKSSISNEAIRCSGGIPLGCGGCNGAGFGACTNERDLEKKSKPIKHGGDPRGFWWRSL